MLHGENVLTHILFTHALCDRFLCANGRDTGFLGGPESYEYRFFNVEVVQSIKMTEDKAKALIAPVYKDSKATKQLGSADIPYLGGGTAKLTHSPPPKLVPILSLIHVLKRGLPLAKRPLPQCKHMWTIQWDG